MKRTTKSIRDILLYTVSILTLIILSLAIYQTYLEMQKLLKVESLKSSAFLRESFFDIIEEMSIERDLTYTLLSTSDENTVKDLLPELNEVRQTADEKVDLTLYSLKKYDFPQLIPYSTSTKNEYEKLQALRKQADKAISAPSPKNNSELAKQWFSQSTTTMIQMQDLWMEFTERFVDIDPRITQQMMLQHFLGIVIEYAGRERALIGGMLVSDSSSTPEDQAQLLQWQGAVDNGWNIIGKLAERSQLGPEITPFITDAKSHYATLHGMVDNIFYVPGVKPEGPYPISAEFWIEIASQTTDSFNALKDAVTVEARNYLSIKEKRAIRRIILNSAILIFALILCFYSFRVILRRVINPINDMVSALISASGEKNISQLPADMANHDEIAKLEYVLDIFRQNAEQIKRDAVRLEHYNKELEHSNKELDDFAYIASHDLKEPLRGLHNYSRFLLEDNQDKLDKDSVDKLHRLSYLSQRMERLVNDLLYFSRLGRKELAIKSTDLNEVIRDIESTLDELLRERNARIYLPKPLPVITCDSVRITEVFRNLIVNGVKYNDQPEKIIEIRFHEEMLHNNIKTRNVFYVKDNGRGIAPQFHEEIFRIFRRLQNDGKEEGTGVGLTFVKKIIERHGGKIWLDSEPGKGTIFYFTMEEL